MKNEDIILAKTVKLKMIEMLKCICPDSFRCSMKNFEEESMSALDIFDAVLYRMTYIEKSLQYTNERLQYSEAHYNELSSKFAEQLALQPSRLVFEVKDQKMADSIISAINYGKSEGDNK